MRTTGYIAAAAIAGAELVSACGPDLDRDHSALEIVVEGVPLEADELLVEAQALPEEGAPYQALLSIREVVAGRATHFIESVPAGPLEVRVAARAAGSLLSAASKEVVVPAGMQAEARLSLGSGGMPGSPGESVEVVSVSLESPERSVDALFARRAMGAPLRDAFGRATQALDGSPTSAVADVIRVRLISRSHGVDDLQDLWTGQLRVEIALDHRTIEVGRGLVPSDDAVMVTLMPTTTELDPLLEGFPDGRAELVVIGSNDDDDGGEVVHGVTLAVELTLRFRRAP